MRDKLGLLLMEDAKGGISVQLFADPRKARQAFVELAGKPGDSPSRATFLRLDWEVLDADMEFKDLPEILDKSEEPDGWELGVGPIHLKKESDDGVPGDGE